MKDKQKIGYSTNNLLAMLAVLLIVFSIWSAWMTNHYVEITSRTVNGIVSFCFEDKSTKIDFVKPAEREVVSGNTTIKTECEAGAQYVGNITYYLVKDTATSYKVGTVADDTLGYFLKETNTTKYPDGNCNYRVYAVVNYKNLQCVSNGDALSWTFTINNHNVPPVWTHFRNNLTTNFSRFSSWVNLSNVTVSDGKYGMIKFPFNSNFDNLDLDSNIIFNHSSILLKPGLVCQKLDFYNHTAIVYLFNLTYMQPGILLNGEKCGLCNIINYTKGTLIFSIQSLGNYTLYEEGALNLEISDDTDGLRKYYIKNNVGFYANLTDKKTGKEYYSPNITCFIDFDLPYENTSDIVMKYNFSKKVYYYFRNFSQPGTFNWHVFCNASSVDLGTAYKEDYFVIVNRKPVLIAELPNETWIKNSVLVGRDLDDYFMDPDNDTLNYSVESVDNINIMINSTSHVYIAQPETNWYGNRTVVFYAKDPWGATASSNEVLFQILNVNPIPKTSSSGTARPKPPCIPKWECDDWGKCKPTGIRTRRCVDLNHCNSSFYTPPMVLNCTYVPTCQDHIKNQGEEGVDCGGPCPPCPSCHDGIKNQGEEGVDCGGPCSPCPSCHDGIQNEGELGIDCGGPCSPCPSCHDGIQNEGEEGVDCGGPCQPCEKEVKIEKPAFNKAFWAIFSISSLTAVSLALVLSSKFSFMFKFLYSIIFKIIPRGFENNDAFYRYLDDFTEVLSKINELKSTKDEEELNYVMENFFEYLIGDYKDIYEKIEVSFLSLSTKEMMREFYEKKDMSFNERIYKAENIVISAFFDLSTLIGLDVQGVFDRCIGIVHKSKKEALKKIIYEAYLRLPMDVKGKVYKRLKEIDEKTMSSKTMLFILAVLFMLGIGIAFHAGPTGFSVLSRNLEVQKLPVFYVGINQTVEYPLVIENGKKPYRIITGDGITVERGKLKIGPFYKRGIVNSNLTVCDFNRVCISRKVRIYVT